MLNAFNDQNSMTPNKRQVIKCRVFFVFVCSVSSQVTNIVLLHSFWLCPILAHFAFLTSKQKAFFCSLVEEAHKASIKVFC